MAILSQKVRKMSIMLHIAIWMIFSFSGGALAWNPITTVVCKFKECCREPWVKHQITGLSDALHTKLHGQHLVHKTVIPLLRGHLQNENPSKALVIAFHGPVGTGKNFVSNIIAESIYKKGFKSKFVHLRTGVRHYPHKSRVEQYRDEIHGLVENTVKQCPRSLFIFDELDKMAEGVIDGLKPYLDYYQHIDGVDYRKAIFIFLSNTASTAITNHTLFHYKQGSRREDIQLHDLEELILQASFNEESGLRRSNVIETRLVDAHIPFLPLERKHVKLCINDDMLSKNYHPAEKHIEAVANEITFYPPDMKVFSNSGCKLVSAKVNFIKEEL